VEGGGGEEKEMEREMALIESGDALGQG